MAAADLGQFIGSHALLLFGMFAVVMLGLTALLWSLVRHYGDRCWRVVARCWTKLLQSAAVARLLARVPGLRKLRENSFTAGGYLGIHGAAGFLVILLAVNAFAGLAEEIVRDGAFGRFDNELTSTLARTLPPAALRAFYWVTQLGNKHTLIVLGISIAALLLCARRWLLACSWSLALAGNGLLNQFLKSIFQRVRPLHEHGLLIETGWSFPSGHASGALVAYGMLAYLLVRSTSHRWHLPVVCIAIGAILLIGFSRVFLQVHYFSDVVAGYMSGAAWLAVCVAGSEIALGHRQRRSAAGARA